MVLKRGAAGDNGRVQPVNLVGLADVHADAVHPVVLGGELVASPLSK